VGDGESEANQYRFLNDYLDGLFRKTYLTIVQFGVNDFRVERCIIGVTKR
jgi:hypothetical protein